MKAPRVRTRASALIIATLGVAMQSVVQAPDDSFAAQRQANMTLVHGTFAGASAGPDFIGIGPACPRGAQTAGGTPSDGHPASVCTTGAGPVTSDNGAPFGHLRLADDSMGQSAGVLPNKATPANDGRNVTSDQWQYGNRTGPADGVSILVDSITELIRPGALGGSPGHAQKLPDDNPANPFLPGVDNGYVGVGLDVLGNYFGDYFGDVADLVNHHGR